MKTRSKPLIASLTAALVLSSGPVLAEYGHEFRDRAKVMATAPVYERVNEPRRECRTEYRTHEEPAYRNGNNTAGAILGAVAGGLLGSTVGKGNGKVAAAAVGAATGAVIGDRWYGGGSATTTARTEPVEVCSLVDNFREQIVAYDVTYRYNGRDYTTRLPNAPGDWLDLNVNFTVVDAPAGGRWKESRNQWFGY